MPVLSPKSNPPPPSPYLRTYPYQTTQSITEPNCFSENTVGENQRIFLTKTLIGYDSQIFPGAKR